MKLSFQIHHPFLSLIPNYTSIIFYLNYLQKFRFQRWTTRGPPRSRWGIISGSFTPTRGTSKLAPMINNTRLSLSDKMHKLVMQSNHPEGKVNRTWQAMVHGDCYRPQTKLRKGYVFTPVYHSVHGGGAVCPSASWDTPPGQTPPARHPPGQPHPQQTATAADGTHPTGMHSCYIICIFQGLGIDWDLM